MQPLLPSISVTFCRVHVQLCPMLPLPNPWHPPFPDSKCLTYTEPHNSCVLFCPVLLNVLSLRSYPCCSMWQNHFLLYIPHILLTHSSTRRHLGGFHFLALVTNAAGNWMCTYLFSMFVYLEVGFLANMAIVGFLNLDYGFWKI